MTEPPAGLAPALGRWRQIIRYYQTGLLNLAFGYGVFSALITAGLNAYTAQAISHTLGVAFNYFSYSRHVFTEAQSAKWKFLLSYIGNYFLSLAVLIVMKKLFMNDYVAGFLGVVLVSLVNFFVLKHIVFTRPSRAPDA